MRRGAEPPPDPARWRRLQDIFADARDTDGDERERLLIERCGTDTPLLHEVRALLAADEATGALDALGARLTSVVDVLGDTVPQKVGPYIVSDETGRGGMGVVYRGYDPRLHRNVAIKLIAPDMVADPATRQRFINEARLASALDHPNICTIYDIGTLPDGRIYLAMAYYGRGTLADLLSAGPLPIDEATAIARQLASALECAHEAGVVHRDVKPRNVAFGERGEARLLDFGIAVLGHDGGSTASSAGTPAYMAPEQVRGDRVDARADVWALGVLIFEMLCGRRPFTGDRDAVLHAITETDAPGPAALRPDVPADVAAIVERALRRDPAERFATAGELEAALADATRSAAMQRAATDGTARDSVAIYEDSAVTGLRRATMMRRAGVFVIMMAATGVLAFVTEVRPWRAAPDAGPADLSAADYFQRGRARYHEGAPDLEAAITLLRSSVELDPLHAPARAFLARAFARSTLPDNSRAAQPEWVDSAEVHARLAVELAPDRADGYSALGSIALARGRREQALALHARALEIDPRYVYSVAEVAGIYAEMQRVGESMRWSERALMIDPTLGAVRVELIIAYRQWELPDEARRHIAEGLRLRPDHASLLWEGAQLELVLGDTASARSYFERYLQLLPTFEQSRLNAWYEYIRDNPSAALPHVERVAPAASTWFDLRMYGLVHISAGDTARGRPLLRRAVDIILTAAEAPGGLHHRQHFVLGHLFAGLEQHDDALHWLTSWEDAGGFRSWRRLEQEAGWLALRHDERFRSMVARNDSAFRERRQQILNTR